jgi:hypothetical protein
VTCKQGLPHLEPRGAKRTGFMFRLRSPPRPQLLVQPTTSIASTSAGLGTPFPGPAAHIDAYRPRLESHLGNG